jgi:hypothetical protein
MQKQLESQNALTIQSHMNTYEITNIAKLQASSPASSVNIERFLNEFLSNMMSTLLVIPDNPEQGVLYLLTGVLNLIQKHYTWENLEIKFNLLCNALVILSALKQDEYLYHVNEGENNYLNIFLSI